MQGGAEKIKFYNRRITPVHLKMLGLFVLSVFPVWFITAFRYDVGTDYFFTYVPRFQLTLQGERPFTEPVFNILYWLIAALNLDVVWVFIITGAFIVCGVYRFCFRYSRTPLLSIALFYVMAIYFSSLNNVRQYVAMVFGLFGMYQKRTRYALILFVLSGLTHLSGLVYIPVFFILKLAERDYSRKRYIIVSLVCMALSFFIYFALKQILLLTKYAYFFDSYIDNVIPLSDIAVNAALFVLSAIYFDRKDAEYKKLSMLTVMSLVVCFVGVFLRSMELTSRILRLFTIFQMLFVGAILKKEPRMTVRLIEGAVIVAAYFTLTWFAIVVNRVYEVLPYQFVFGKKINL